MKGFQIAFVITLVLMTLVCVGIAITISKIYKEDNKDNSKSAMHKKVHCRIIKVIKNSDISRFEYEYSVNSTHEAVEIIKDIDHTKYIRESYLSSTVTIIDDKPFTYNGTVKKLTVNAHYNKEQHKLRLVYISRIR